MDSTADTQSHGERVKASILAEGLALWRIDPATVTARRIAKMIGVTHGAVLYHFGTSAGMRDAIAGHAVAVCDPVVVPMLIASRHPAVDALTAGERKRYLAGC